MLETEPEKQKDLTKFLLLIVGSILALLLILVIKHLTNLSHYPHYNVYTIKQLKEMVKNKQFPEEGKKFQKREVYANDFNGCKASVLLLLEKEKQAGKKFVANIIVDIDEKMVVKYWNVFFITTYNCSEDGTLTIDKNYYK